MTTGLRMDETLQFWTDVSCSAWSEGPGDVLAQYEADGWAMRFLDFDGAISWKASPWMLSMLADLQRDAEDDLSDEC
jgi:hypothetical protein